MKNDRLPWFPFYAKDWLDVKVLMMPLEEQGAYIRILVHMWADSKDQCSIPNDPAAIARLLGITTRKVKKFFENWQRSEINLFDDSDPKIFRSRKLMELKQIASKLSVSRSLAGKKGAKMRWEKTKKDITNERQTHSKTIANGMANDGYNTYNNKHNTIREEEEKTEGIPPHLVELVNLARKAKIPNRLSTLIKYIDAWVVRVGETEVEDILKLDEIQGLNIIQLEDEYFSSKNPYRDSSDISSMIQDALKQPIVGQGE